MNRIFSWIKKIVGFSVLSVLIFFVILVKNNYPNLGETIPGKPSHHRQYGFVNPPGSIAKQFSSKTFAFLWERIRQRDIKPVIPVDFALNPKDALASFNALSNQDSITWIGHMTAVIRMQGKTILIDPWFTERLGPFYSIGPKRVVPLAIALKDLPPIDFVVISHNHYDHLDLPTLQMLPNPEKITVIAPLKVSRYFKHIAFKKIIELDWYESYNEAEITITALPVIHWSRRTLFDTNKSLWASFAIQSSSGKKVFFGEGEYGDIYKEIGEKMQGFDVAFLAVGAYLPREIMRGSHCTPKDCLQLGLDLQADKLVPVHWGTVSLGSEGLFEPGQLFLDAAKEAKINEARIWKLKIGETRAF